MLKKGFTLIELLVVITILAILAGAALPYVQNYVSESRIAKAKTDLEEIARALAVYETREGDYVKTTVEDLTGRYLNKAPIDPWGKSYKVATDSGLVISGGPDRDLVSAEDNIQVPFQPPLALVSVKWVDRNQSGAVDTQNSSDTIQLTFSRRLANSEAGDLEGSSNKTPEIFGMIGTSTPFNVLFEATNTLKIVASRTFVYNVLVDNAFVPGSDSIQIKSNKILQDVANPANLCISSQPVVILPQ
ncbi:MAG TPA: prepilin-type N-terminal cleavage/methylation domain-containing protein [Candidatus Rifleibacterium sp.]|mgnify:CR=1 FL=1|nr:prepilin-type N-terminal cleavage/methylation domain-containing protein [Candidatus Rifleibacterium sp.]HPT47513.1 prepilin-type N-terminal cleavage/methylation domain-containing protein [Candidatus Rifleibacterium sp.]